MNGYLIPRPYRANDFDQDVVLSRWRDPRNVFTCSDLLFVANDSFVMRRRLLRLRSWLDLMNGFPKSVSTTGGIGGDGEHLLTGVGYLGAFSDAGMILSKQSDELSLLSASY